MRQLFPAYAEDADLRALYAHPVGLGGGGSAQHRAWVRANMVSSLDGAAAQEGLSEGLSGPADKTVFGVLRGMADVVLVGAGTARAEGYKAPRARPSYADLRAGLGQRPAPALALVSRGLDLDPVSALFTGDERTIVVTCAASDAAARGRLAEVADVLVAGEEEVDLAYVVAALARRGLPRVLCEGGPRLLGDVLGAGLLDELCLTVSPKTVSGDGPRIVAGAGVDVTFEPAHVLEADGMLLTRYLTRR